jgi:hypothetical protein
VRNKHTSLTHKCGEGDGEGDGGGSG